MKAQYKGTVLFVKDIELAKEFYQGLLEMEIIFDFGESVEFDSGLMLWETEFAHNFIFKRPIDIDKKGSHQLELYFESPDIESDAELFGSSEVELIHELREEPWGQRSMRLYDPDRHIIEIAEPMELVALRLHKEGQSNEAVAEKTQLPVEYVENIVELGDLIYLKWEETTIDKGE